MRQGTGSVLIRRNNVERARPTILSLRGVRAPFLSVVCFVPQGSLIGRAGTVFDPPGSNQYRHSLQVSAPQDVAPPLLRRFFPRFPLLFAVVLVPPMPRAFIQAVSFLAFGFSLVCPCLALNVLLKCTRSQSHCQHTQNVDRFFRTYF